MSDHDSSFIKTFGGVIVGLAVLAFILYFAAQYVIEKSGIMNTPEAEQVRAEAIDKRITPIGKVRLHGENVVVASAESAAPRSTADIVSGTCGGCHNSGVMGAPKIGTKADWESRYANGVDGLLKHAIDGLNGMPPRGGAADLTDEQLKDAIIAMLNDSGYDIPVAAAEETAPAAAAEPAAAADAAPAASDAIGNMMNSVADTMGTAANTVRDAATSATEAVTDATTSAVAAVSAPASDNGKATYEGTCVACHAAGVAGAPRLGDKPAWTARISQGIETLNHHAVKGFRGMPPKGGRMDLSDDDVTAAVAYMLESVK